MSEAGYPTSDVLSVERRDHVAVVWLDRAEKRNAMAHAFWVDLPAIMDPGKLAELVCTGRDFDTETALEVGLVSHVYPDGAAVVKQAVALVDEIAANSPLAVQGAKAVISARDRAAMAEQLDYVALWNSAFFHSEDLTEAVQAFMEKRPPKYEGN